MTTWMRVLITNSITAVIMMPFCLVQPEYAPLSVSEHLADKMSLLRAFLVSPGLPPYDLLHITLCGGVPAWPLQRHMLAILVLNI